MLGCRGNLLLNRVVGSKMVLLPPLSYEGNGPVKGLKDKMDDYKRTLE